MVAAEWTALVFSHCRCKHAQETKNQLNVSNACVCTAFLWPPGVDSLINIFTARTEAGTIGAIAALMWKLV